jgi:hypothetical protein
MKYLFIISMLLCISFVHAQEQQAKKEELFDDAEYFFWSEDYEEALYYYLELIKLEPENANFNYKIGESYLNIPGKEPLGIPYFEKAIENLTEKKEYQRKSFTEQHAPLHALFYLGNAYRINNELDKALQIYEQFVSSPWYEGEYNLSIVNNEIEATERAKIIKDSPTSILQHNIGEPVNTGLEEFNPVISGDGNTLVFVRGLKFYDAIFLTTKINGRWSEPVNINTMIGSDGEMYPTGLSFNGKKLLLVRHQKNNDDIYLTQLDEKIWDKAKPLSDNINTRKNENHASFSDDGLKIFFSSDRRGGEGGYDIWVSELHNHEWKKPDNLGETINTEFDESTPFSVNNGKTLYFSSKGHYNMGGYDIFYSNIENNNWKTPVNIGYPINTTGDNQFFVPLNKGKNAMTALTKSDGHGGSDIYLIDILSKPTHLVADRNFDRVSEPTHLEVKNSFNVLIVNELTTDTLGVLRYNKKSDSFEITDYNDNFKFVIE